MRRSLTAFAVAVVLALQFVVPTWGLFSERPSRFAWQMYAQIGPRIEFRVETREGLVVLAPPDVGGHRIEVDYFAMTPPQICAGTDATSVEVWTSGSLYGVVECR